MISHKEIFLKKFNEAFARGDFEYILNCVTDDIRWNMIGDKIIEGKKAFTKALHEMENESPMELSIHNIITHGDMAAVDGIIRSHGKKWYGFCDIYKVLGYKNPQIQEMTSYVIEVNEEHQHQKLRVSNYEKS